MKSSQAALGPASPPAVQAELLSGPPQPRAMLPCAVPSGSVQVNAHPSR